MNAFTQQIGSKSHSQISVVLDIVANAPHVYVSESESQNASKRESKKNPVNLVLSFVSVAATWLAWLAQASIVRSVGPGVRSQQRHEFESLESRQRGFGNVF